MEILNEWFVARTPKFGFVEYKKEISVAHKEAVEKQLMMSSLQEVISYVLKDETKDYLYICSYSTNESLRSKRFDIYDIIRVYQSGKEISIGKWLSEPITNSNVWVHKSV